MDMQFSDLIEKLYEKKKYYTQKDFWKRTVYWGRRLFKPFSRMVYVIGVPEYSNIGDNAIFLAEKAYLQKCGIASKRIECITEHEFMKDAAIIRQWIGTHSLLCGLGGGNMGNQYHTEEKVRRMMLQLFPKNPIIIFPQTIHYAGETKAADERKSIEYYNNKKNVTLIAREEESQRIMGELYPDTTILLVPDIVLSSSMDDYEVLPKAREGVLFCTRNDKEKSVDNSVWRELKELVISNGYTYRDTDMYSECAITKDNRKKCVKTKMEEFCAAELVLTDRLHGMIFAALTGTPCIVFSNNNHKVEGTYQWLSGLSYIRYVSTVQEAIECFSELINTKNCKYKSMECMYTQLNARICQWNTAGSP